MDYWATCTNESYSEMPLFGNRLERVVDWHEFVRRCIELERRCHSHLEEFQRSFVFTPFCSSCPVPNQLELKILLYHIPQRKTLKEMQVQVFNISLFFFILLFYLFILIINYVSSSCIILVISKNG